MPRSAPSVSIRFEVEAAPRVFVDVLDVAEEKRLVDWLAEARPDYGALVTRAFELAAQARAA
jgi:hypothetical protein